MDRLAKFAAAKNYALYYGVGREEELSRFDVVIVEPAGQSGTSVRKMQDSGTLVLAYLSVMEIHPSTPEMKLLKSSDILIQDGCPLMNQEYGNYLVDLRSNRWVGLLLHRAGRLITHLGYDGLFLDTIGDVESSDYGSDLRDSLLLAAANIVRQLRAVFPGEIIVQNCGLEKLCSLTSGFINGICWENPPFEIEASRPWIKAIVARLENLRESYGLKILLLLENSNEIGLRNSEVADGINFQLAREIAISKKFLLYMAPLRYVNGVNLPGL